MTEYKMKDNPDIVLENAQIGDWIDVMAKYGSIRVQVQEVRGDHLVGYKEENLYNYKPVKDKLWRVDKDSNGELFARYA